MKKLIIASTSTLHDGNYLAYLETALKEHFNNVKQLLFIPYARPSGISHDEYTQKVAVFFKTLNIEVKGIHEFKSPTEAIKNAEAVFTGGGNTFLLVHDLYQNQIIKTLKEVVENGTPYLGTSAGSNICGLNMKTTNDMPIIYPPSFDTLGFIPFNINPHYLDPDTNSKHMGETRETRIKEFQQLNDVTVLGLREGSWLEVLGEKITLKGTLSARLFQKGKEIVELESGSDLGFLKI